MILPITLTIAAAAALINIWLAIRIGRIRMGRNIMLGHGGDPALEARMRAHANFNEYTPIFLILLGLVELARGTTTWLWAVAIVYVIGRIAHAFGMDRPTPNPLRVTGAVVTMLVLLGLAIYALTIPYVTRGGSLTTVVGAG